MRYCFPIVPVVVLVMVWMTPVVHGLRDCEKNQHQHRSRDECVVWHTYNEALLGQSDTVRTEHQALCRVLKLGNSSDEYYYEFGTMDMASSPPFCFLHRNDDSRLYKDFQIAGQSEACCDSFWAPLSYDVDPLGPNIVRVGSAPELESSPDVAICRVGHQFIGRLFMQGSLFGHCGYLSKNGTEQVFVGGDFHVLSAIPRGSQEVAQMGTTHQEWNNLITEIQKRVRLYLSDEDKRLIASVSGHSVEELLEHLNNTDINEILSTTRFIPHHVLNEKGLVLLRAVLAEQMILARRRRLGLERHPDTALWERDGVLLKDFDYYTNEQNMQEFEDLLQMVAASKTVSVAKLKWIERNVTSLPNDPQREPHIDTFHSVVKMWVYERGVVTNDTGPLHFMRGSNRNTKGKLEWMYNVSLPPATDAIKEPSLRFHGEQSSMTDILRPVLPLDCYKRTLVIADTSGIHHRGNALPGTVRKTLRLSDGNDGGLPRLNPYVWDGWDRPARTIEKAECLESESLRTALVG